jgi:hypothetical protein
MVYMLEKDHEYHQVFNCFAFRELRRTNNNRGICLIASKHKPDSLAASTYSWLQSVHTPGMDEFETNIEYHRRGGNLDIFARLEPLTSVPSILQATPRIHRPLPYRRAYPHPEE